MISVAPLFLTVMQINQIPVWDGKIESHDWLVEKITTKANVFRSEDSTSLILSNGLIYREFRMFPNLATIAFDHLQTKEGFLRAIKPEGDITLNGKSFQIGGLVGQKDLAYLTKDWINGLKNDPQAFQFQGFEVNETQANVTWKRVRHHTNLNWPPLGKSLSLTFAAPKSSGLDGVSVVVHYEIYDSIPVIAKWLTIRNGSQNQVTLNGFKSEVLGVVERESTVDSTDQFLMPRISVFSEMAFGGTNNSIHCRTISWKPDSQYSTQVNYEKQTPCVLEIHPPIGPEQTIEPGHEFSTFRAYEMLQDTDDRERKSLGARKFYRTLAPWITENPIMLHLATTRPDEVYPAIDQAAECGFEMVVISFWSGLDMENLDAENIKKFSDFRKYANSKGLELGGYSLLASRSIDAENDVINPQTGKTGGAIFGNSPCLCSKWGQSYFAKLKTFIEKTGFQLLEHDGNYPGDVCASKDHPGHKGLEDSQWNQWTAIREFYQFCRERGLYLNVPDWYFLAGSNKTGMGYRESNWSLPREQQHIHARQNLYDGTWDKTPSMGWMMTPLVEYQGGGPAATIEPLKDHLPDYEQHLMNCFGYGAQSCYRGTRLYDCEETKRVVIRAVNWFKKYRDILESDVIHIQRADGRNLDAILHVNPQLANSGMLMAFNPSKVEIEQVLKVPLYYTGIKSRARVRVENGSEKSIDLQEGGSVSIKVKVPGNSRTWVTFQQG